MDVIVIFNGLGNQMSQYAFYRQKKSINKNTYFIIDGKAHNKLELNNVFNLNLKTNVLQWLLCILYRLLRFKKVQVISKILKFVFYRMLNCRITNENYNYNFNKFFLQPSKGVNFYFGGWPSERYFLPVKNIITNDFKFTNSIGIENLKYKDYIISHNSVAIHIRRGDYLDSNNINLFGDVCNQAYFEAAIKVIDDNVENPHFFVFSNDFLWVREHLNIKNMTCIMCNTGNNSWKDMYLMSICKHNIISNSTFSWWAAWLNTNRDKIVISPNRYLKNDISTDFYPQQWRKLSNY